MPYIRLDEIEFSIGSRVLLDRAVGSEMTLKAIEQYAFDEIDKLIEKEKNT